jgi:hypothetical protein
MAQMYFVNIGAFFQMKLSYHTSYHNFLNILNIDSR